ncbi:MAG: RNA-binding cell elongation regulator Jag/EloR [Bacillota bacterium]|nr:RNA-binding cell elongation regulator Jag/EloR [Bacillota bacterium]
MGSKLAKVRVEKKQETKADKAAEKYNAEIEEEIEKFENKEKAADAEVKTETEAKPVAEAPAAGAAEEEYERELPDINDILKLNVEMEPVEDHAAITFIKEMTEKMGLDLAVTAKKGDGMLYVSIDGKDAGTVIGKRGQTLDAVQYLTSLVVNKDEEKYVRVVVDAENYRTKRGRTLEQLAEKLARKVVKNKRSVRLEPMNPYERKVIHATLQGHPKVTTRSIGDEPRRRVIIELK